MHTSSRTRIWKVGGCPSEDPEVHSRTLTALSAFTEEEGLWLHVRMRGRRAHHVTRVVVEKKWEVRAKEEMLGDRELG